MNDQQNATRVSLWCYTRFFLGQEITARRTRLKSSGMVRVSYIVIVCINCIRRMVGVIILESELMNSLEFHFNTFSPNIE